MAMQPSWLDSPYFITAVLVLSLIMPLSSSQNYLGLDGNLHGQILDNWDQVCFIYQCLLAHQTVLSTY